MILLLLLLSTVFPGAVSSSGYCNRTCGDIPVPYPFGFSGGCPIPLNCSEQPSLAVTVGGFTVRNFTTHALLVDVPPSCDRHVSIVRRLYGPNYAMKPETSLLLRGCTAAASGCIITTALLARGFNLTGCGPSDDSIRCYSAGAASSDLPATNCTVLFTSVCYESAGLGSMALPSLVFRTAELQWWIDGDCRCSPEAECTALRSPVTGGQAFRCSCKDGYDGDGFLDGGGCRRAIGVSCNPSKYMSGTCGGTNRVALLVGGIVSGAVVMAVVALVCLAIRRRSLSLGTWKKAKRLLSQASCTAPVYTYKDIERATNGFSSSQRLGTGAYGTVYAGRLPSGKLVAVKRLRHRPDSDGDHHLAVEKVLNEVSLLSSVSHPNLVRLLGCCIERPDDHILVYEFMPNGTLAEHLQRQRGRVLPWSVRLSVAAETADAIAHLHSVPIYHRDIKSSNILLDSLFKPKVADFGLSRTGAAGDGGSSLSHISTAPQGTPGYVDPEYHQNFHLSDKSDVYSFGVVLAEIITGLRVVDFDRPAGEVNLAVLAVDRIGRGMLEEIVDPFLDCGKDPWTMASVHKVGELGFRCLAFHRDMRPTMREVARELEQIKASAWTEDNNNTTVFLTPPSSLRSSPATSVKSWRPFVSSSGRPVEPATNEGEGKMVKSSNSPVSVHEPWISDVSSPSANSLLGARQT